MRHIKVGWPMWSIDTHDPKWYPGLRFTITRKLFTLRCGHWNICLMRKPCKQQDRGEWFK